MPDKPNPDAVYREGDKAYDKDHVRVEKTVSVPEVPDNQLSLGLEDNSAQTGKK